MHAATDTHILYALGMKRIGTRVIFVIPDDELAALDAACLANALKTKEPCTRSQFLRRAVRQALQRLEPPARTHSEG